MGDLGRVGDEAYPAESTPVATSGLRGRDWVCEVPRIATANSQARSCCRRCSARAASKVLCFSCMQSGIPCLQSLKSENFLILTRPYTRTLSRSDVLHRSCFGHVSQKYILKKETLSQELRRVICMDIPSNAYSC
jgi:hypothetical protein